MAQANSVQLMTTRSCASVILEMYPERATDSAVRVTINQQLMTPDELRVVARLLEQAADRKEVLFTVVSAA